MAAKKKKVTKTKETREAASPAADQREVKPLRSYELDGNKWYVACGMITAIAILLRSVVLAMKPFHHDEGVNGHFLKSLINDGVYKYDPANYHGPTLYYISLAFSKLFGFETVPVRASVAVFGVLMVVLVFYLRRYLGTIGTLTAAFFIAVSPGMVYISRYFIHEIIFIFLSLAIVVAIVQFMDRERAGYGAAAYMWAILFTILAPTPVLVSKAIGGDSEGAVATLRVILFVAAAGLAAYGTKLLMDWRGGRPIYIILAAASASLLFGTKETAFITLGTMIIAAFSVWIWRLLNAVDAYQKSWLRLVIGFHIGVVVVAVVFRSELVDAAAWLSSTFMTEGSRSYDPLVYYSILLMIVLAAASWFLFISDRNRSNASTIQEPAPLTLERFREGLGSPTDAALILGAAVAVFVALIVVFFTSFFTYADGFWKFFEAYNIWTKTGSTAHTQNGYPAYIKWGMKVEAPIMIMSLVGLLIAYARGLHRFGMFVGLWALGMFLAYTIIPYKTPWLLLSFLLPMCLAAGYGLNEMINSREVMLRGAAVALLGIGSVVLLHQTYQHNFVRHDDEEMTYVYAHTRRGFLDLMDKVYYYSEKSGKDKEARIEIVTPDYWPMTWYLKDHKQAMFNGSPVDASTAEMIIAKKDQQDTIMISKYAPHYKYEGVYPLRPGVNLVLLVRNDLIDPADAKDVHKVTEYQRVPNYTN
jgi:uncharacterized protein (TIGR03663 family)